MALLPIYIAPDTRLKVHTKTVETVDDDLRSFLDDMLETMYAADGIGLAATQVGDERSVIVIDVGGDDDRKPIKMINPEIQQVSDEISLHEEGCLSVPDYYADVERPEKVTVTYLDEFGAAQEIKADGVLATCIQHEIDHLNGILFVDHISALKRKMILRKLSKAKRQSQPAPV